MVELSQIQRYNSVVYFKIPRPTVKDREGENINHPLGTAQLWFKMAKHISQTTVTCAPRGLTHTLCIGHKCVQF